MNIPYLYLEWVALCKRHRIPQKTRNFLWDQIVSLYTQPHRKYHNLGHLAYCFKIFELFKSNIIRDARSQPP